MHLLRWLCALVLVAWPAHAAVPPGATPPPPASPGERLEYCERLLDVTTPEICTDANQRVDRLPSGTARLAPPNPIFRDAPVEVYFEVSRPGVRSLLEEGGDVREFRDVGLSRHMSAVLVGEGFRIDPAQPAGRRGGEPVDLGASNNQIWRWNVTAVQAPAHNLRIEVYVHIPIKNKDGSDTFAVQPVLAQAVRIPVRTTFGQKANDLAGSIGHWLNISTTAVKLLTGFVVAIGALLTAWFGLPAFRRRRNSQAGSTAA